MLLKGDSTGRKTLRHDYRADRAAIAVRFDASKRRDMVRDRCCINCTDNSHFLSAKASGRSGVRFANGFRCLETHSDAAPRAMPGARVRQACRSTPLTCYGSRRALVCRMRLQRGDNVRIVLTRSSRPRRSPRSRRSPTRRATWRAHSRRSRRHLRQLPRHRRQSAGDVPSLAGQSKADLVQKMNDFRDGTSAGDDHARSSRRATRDEQIDLSPAGSRQQKP